MIRLIPELNGYKLLKVTKFIELDGLFKVDDKYIVLTKIIYDYYHESYPGLKLFDQSMIDKVDLEFNSKVLHIPSDLSEEVIEQLIVLNLPKKLVLLGDENPQFYHSDITMAEILCIQYGVEFIKGSSHPHINELIKL